MPILTIEKKQNEKFLRQPTQPFDFARHTKKEIRELVKTMRQTMKAAEGVGLSANQIGLNVSLFVAQVENKFYAIFNPKVVKRADGEMEAEEGCLSVPEKYGMVPRAEKIWLEGQSPDGKKIKIKAWGFLARVFQHEVDHLNGKLFIDHAREIRVLRDAGVRGHNSGKID